MARAGGALRRGQSNHRPLRHGRSLIGVGGAPEPTSEHGRGAVVAERVFAAVRFFGAHTRWGSGSDQ